MKETFEAEIKTLEGFSDSTGISLRDDGVIKGTLFLALTPNHQFLRLGQAVRVTVETIEQAVAPVQP
jgi:hypothetical protein